MTNEPVMREPGTVASTPVAPSRGPGDGPSAEQQLEVLEWAEKAGIENLKTHLESSNLLAAAANNLVNFLLAGVAGSLPFAVKALDPAPPPIAWGALAACVHLSAVCVYVVLFVLKAGPMPSLYNEPKTLGQTQWTKADLLREELSLMNQRIHDLCDRNELRAKRLNRARLAAVLAAGSFLLATGAARFLGFYLLPG